MSSVYPFEYEVEVSYENTKYHGVTFAKNYGKAAKNIENYYGDELVTIKLFCMEEQSVYEFEETQGEYSHGVYKIEKFSKYNEDF